MRRNSNIILLLILVSFMAQSNALGQGIVHNLEPEWTYYDEGEQGFLPAVMQSDQGKTVSFPLSVDDYNQFYLSIGLAEKGYLFHNNKLLAILPAGTTNLKIDSLASLLSGTPPTLTIYGDNLTSGLTTVIANEKDTELTLAQVRSYNDQFLNFFIIVGLALLVALVVLRTMFLDVFSQYTDLLRLVDLKTMDELIYKLRFFSTPNIYFILFMSMLVSWALISFNEHHPTIISPYLIDLTGDTFGSYLLMWFKITILAALILLGKYVLLIVLSGLFAFNSLAIHYASHLRMVFWTVLIIGAFMILDQYFMLPALVHVIYLGTLVFAALRITLIFLRLMRLGSHTILHLLLYLCATELIPFVFIYKVVIG